MDNSATRQDPGDVNHPAPNTQANKSVKTLGRNASAQHSQVGSPPAAPALMALSYAKCPIDPKNNRESADAFPGGVCYHLQIILHAQGAASSPHFGAAFWRRPTWLVRVTSGRK